MELRDYRLERVIDAGAETRVFCAVHSPSNARVVVKMPIAEIPSPRVMGRLIHEHQVLLQLARAPGVPRARELLQESGTVALVIEDDGFESLDRVLAERGRLPLQTGLRIGKLLSRALEGVHAAGVIHKDVKPRNVLVDKDFEHVTLLDFGCASLLPREATEASAPEALEGTLAYMSPEQTGRLTRACDARTDLYSLGITMFEMLSGRRPFTESDPLALVHAHLAKEPPALDEVVAEIPKGVAAIVTRLLAKDPDRRYQTAKGAAEDLEEALRQWHVHGTVEHFALGTKDFSPNLRLPHVLVGREHEIEQVSASFDRAVLGGVELSLIGGPSGIGKTALVRTVYRNIAQAERGLLIAGKHDQLAQSTPYAALAQAFGALMRQWLASSDVVLRNWQQQIRNEVGDNARLIADVVPEFDLVMGKLAPVQEVHGEQILNRQKLTWLKFVRAVTALNPPLVMFLDDMQWADSATFTILQTLLTDAERQSLLIIAAYRDHETPPEHPLWKLVEAVSKSGANVSRMTLRPLSLEQVIQWTGHALDSEPERVESLARTLWQKTRGVPFFIEQMLLAFHRQGYVVRDFRDGAWYWSQDKIDEEQVTDNVVALLSDKVREMPEATHQILGLASCAGHKFLLGDLERLSGWERARIAAALWPALQEELVVPIDGTYRTAQALGEIGKSALDAGYRFLHDRVQQASYERILPERRALAHLEIGRRLLSQYRSHGGTGQHLLELVRHLNLGAERMGSADERKDLARLNLNAARIAKATSSHRLLASLLDTAQSLLGAEARREEPELFVELALERLEASFMLRDFDDVEARGHALLAMPLPAVARLAVREILVRRCTAIGQYASGVMYGLAALADQGIHFPETDEACASAMLQEGGELARWIEHNPDGFDSMPPDTTPEHLLTDALLAQLVVCAGQGSRPMLGMLAMARGVSEARRRNSVTPISPFLISIFSQGLALSTGMYRGAALWVDPALRAAKRTASPMLGECFYNAGLFAVYSTHVDRSIPLYEQGLEAGLKHGSFQGTSWALLGDMLFARVWRGLPLKQVDAHHRSRWGLMQRAGDAIGIHFFELTASFCHLLLDPRHAGALLAEEPLPRGSRSLLADGDGMTAEHARILESYLFLMTGRFSLAFARALEAEQWRPSIFSHPPVTSIPLLLALTSAKCYPKTTDPKKRAELRGYIEHGLERFRYFVEGCAENFLHKQRLIEAEYARVQGEVEIAMAKYDEAIVLARKQQFSHIEALAAQLCAEFHLEAGREYIGTCYLHVARNAYARWGALAIVAHFEARYRSLLEVPALGAGAERDSTTPDSKLTSTTGDAQFDVHTAVRAAQALSSELDPERVVGRLMELVVENAGAQRGALVLREQQALAVVARLSLDEARIETGLSVPLDESQDVAASVVHYVARTGERVVMKNASIEPRFAPDAYLVSHSVLSLLALPLTYRGHRLGVLYLEHRDMPAAFSPARVELLSVLASQAAIAVENAFLYRNLETKIAERTAELRIAKEAADRANQAKSDFLSSMNHELRTPLNGILGYAQILEHLADMPPKGREGLQVVRKSGEHLLTLINDLLDLAKIEAGRMDLLIKEISFDAFVRTVVALCQVRAAQKRIEFTHELRGHSVVNVFADERRLMQILMNLTGNAIKFTQKGNVALQIDILESDPNAGYTVRFTVVDTGPGIAPEHLGRIFEPFEQVGDRRARSEGTGLGLAITKKIVELMGGTIDVQSELGKGSIFTVTLTLAAAHDAERTTGVVRWDDITGYRGERRTILVVDDDPTSRTVVCDLLTPLGFDLVEAENSESAIEIALKKMPALIVMDLFMPGMDGYETTRRMRQIPAFEKVVIIASSSDITSAEQKALSQAGYDDFLPKPVQARILCEKIQRSLGIEWIFQERIMPSSFSPDPVAAERPELIPPGPEEISRLLDLVDRGRLHLVLIEATRIAQSDPKYAPWAEQLRSLAQSFQLRKIQEFLHACSRK